MAGATPSNNIATLLTRGQPRWLGGLWRVARRVLRTPSGLFGTVVIIAVILVAIFAKQLAPFNPDWQNWGDELLPPSSKYLLGTDNYGRDLLSRVIFGTRISLSVAGLAVGIGASVGIVAGLLSGYFGGWIDTVVMRLSDTVLAYPATLIAIAIVTVLGPSVLNVAYALAIVNVPRFARLMRASVLVEREQEYVLNARCVGVPDWRIMRRHILPNTLGPVMVEVSLALAFAVLLESSLSFLGLGAQPPTPSWGSILSEGRSYIREAWWFGVTPGVALSLLLFGLNSFTDALMKALDPRAEG